jgi:hypothetical protein
MKLSLPLFVVASALLVLCFRHAWAVVRERGLLTVLTLLTLCSCSTQVVTRPNGDRVVNNNVLSKGRIEQRPDGSFVMSGNAEKAAEEIGKGVDRSIGAGLVKEGIGALKSVGNNAVDAIQ